MKKRLLQQTLVIVTLIGICSSLFAGVILPKVIGSNMVVQRNMPVPIWGKALAGEKVLVSFAGQQKNAIADTAGLWQVMLDPMFASNIPLT